MHVATHTSFRSPEIEAVVGLPSTIGVRQLARQLGYLFRQEHSVSGRVAFDFDQGVATKSRRVEV